MKTQENIYEVNHLEIGMRLNRWFQRHFPQITHARLEKFLRTGQIRVEGKRIKSSFRLTPGESIRTPPVHILNSNTAPQNTQQSTEAKKFVNTRDAIFLKSLILYQDEDIIALNKPTGLAVQGGTNTFRHIDGMLDALTDEEGRRPHLVHRLDKDTSGVLLLARHPNAAAWIASAFYHKSTQKTYWATVRGVPQLLEGRIDLPLSKILGDSGERMGPDMESGREAITLYRVMDRVGDHASCLELRPITGRTHQLRVHCAYYLKTPIIGDNKYGGGGTFPLEEDTPMQLHAYKISIPRPQGGVLTVTAPLPLHMQKAWKFFGFNDYKTPQKFS